MGSVADGLEADAGAGGGGSDAEGRAVAGRAVDADAAGVFLNDAVRHRQTKTGTLANALRRVERIVNLRDVLRGDADAGIGDLCDQRSVVRCGRRDLDLSAIRNRITRVEQKVGEN